MALGTKKVARTLGPNAWVLSLRNLHLATITWQLRLGTFVQELSFMEIGLGVSLRTPSFGNFRFVTSTFVGGDGVGERWGKEKRVGGSVPPPTPKVLRTNYATPS